MNEVTSGITSVPDVKSVQSTPTQIQQQQLTSALGALHLKSLTRKEQTLAPSVVTVSNPSTLQLETFPLLLLQ